MTNQHTKEHRLATTNIGEADPRWTAPAPSGSSSSATEASALATASP
jgi:hypothetical protein